MTETQTEAWGRRGFLVIDGKLVPADKIKDAPPVTMKFLPSELRKYPTEGSLLENRFLKLWLECGGVSLTLQREIQLIPNRKFRTDFYHEDSKTAIEIDGGIYSQGRHTRAVGYVQDCIKQRLLALRGIKTIKLPAEHLTREIISEIIEAIKPARHPAKGRRSRHAE